MKLKIILHHAEEGGYWAVGSCYSWLCNAGRKF